MFELTVKVNTAQRYVLDNSQQTGIFNYTISNMSDVILLNVSFRFEYPGIPF